MALRDKLNNLAATATNLAATATTKANSAIETGKLNLKINSEETKISEYTESIGVLILDKLDAGEVFDDEIMALYDSVQASRAVIEGIRAELEVKSPKAPACASCGAELAQDAKFCASCGTKVEEPASEVEPVPEAAPVCASCGAELKGEAKFCDQCGAKTAAEAPVEAPAAE